MICLGCLSLHSLEHLCLDLITRDDSLVLLANRNAHPQLGILLALSIADTALREPDEDRPGAAGLDLAVPGCVVEHDLDFLGRLDVHHAHLGHTVDGDSLGVHDVDTVHDLVDVDVDFLATLHSYHVALCHDADSGSLAVHD